MQRLVRADSGQAILEVALAIPFLIAILVGIIDLGRLAQFDTLLTTSARAGASYGALNLVTANDIAGMKAAAQSDPPSWASITANASNFCKCADGSSTSCTATACSANHRLLYVSVTTSGTFRPIFKWLLATSVTAKTKTVVMQVGQ
jgi:Flp pilus assembly protein TadG